MSLSTEEARPMVGQVGGISVHKKPLLTLKPDYVLKPLLADHRGIREIAFYEAARTASENPGSKRYSAFLSTADRKRTAAGASSLGNHLGELVDTVAMAFAIFVQDQVVIQSEVALREAWRALKREADLLRRLSRFMPTYYGVLGQRAVSANTPHGVTEDAHLLLQDLTINFSKPCVMDLKMGCQSYEPDATPEKRAKEFGKYPEQAQFGFRIVGMRFYDPTHPDANGKGFRYFQKPYGRALKTREELLRAFRIFFSAGINDHNNQNNINGSSNRTRIGENNGTKSTLSSRELRIRTRAISGLLVNLRPLRRWFEENNSIRFYASSLLIVYEGDTSNGVDTTSIKMIDFGRVRREAGGDDGYAYGLETLKQIFVDLLEDENQRIERRPSLKN
jgi:hypothetical protein